MKKGKDSSKTRRESRVIDPDTESESESLGGESESSRKSRFGDSSASESSRKSRFGDSSQ